VKFDTTTGSSSLVAFNNGDNKKDPGEIQDLHRPEGLTFGPDGNLYVTGFRADKNDNDKILILDGTSGALRDEIALDQVHQPRSFAQAIEFGPDGKLFVPISGNGPDTGSVRSYDVTTKTYTTFVAPGGPLAFPWYLTFGKTDPAALAYSTSSVPQTGQAAPAGTQGLTPIGASTQSVNPDQSQLLVAPLVDQTFAQTDLLHPPRRRAVP
jgi:hypothetical protein